MIAGQRIAATVSNLQMVDVVFDYDTHRCREYLNGQEMASVDEFAEDENHTSLDWNMDLDSHDITQPTIQEQQMAGRRYTLDSYSPELQRLSLPRTQSHDASATRESRRSHSLAGAENETQAHVTFQTPLSSIDNPLSAPSLPTIREDDHLLSFTLPELESLDYLTDRDPFQAFGDSLWPPMSNGEADTLLDMDHVPAESPDMYAMYYPNATYRELHTTLYNAMVDTARGTGLTRTGTPDSEKSQKVAGHEPVSHTPQWETPQRDSATNSNLPKGMTVRREMELWRNYLDEIALWLDMFDNDRHFQIRLPLLAQSSEPLRLSVLALSARQIERRDPNKPYTESLALYQEAIRLIAAELEGMSTEVIGSCVLLCVLEMMSSSPKDWTRHLNGAAMLLKAAGINGVVGGMRQAIFWCFARMDMWGGFLSGSHTKIPTSLWFLPTGSMSTAISRFKTDFQNFDSYANYSLFLCASVLNVVSSRGTFTERDSSYSAKWKALFDLLIDWHANRPREMQPLIPGTSEKDDEGPFPVVIYTNAAAVSANQLYHTATLLMLQAKPSGVKVRGQRSIFWHARQVIGISVSNLLHAAWTNAPQPIYIAGKVMSSKAEHRVVLDALAEIERTTGFATQWRAQDLKEYWGDEAD
ncbi:hypothetical protein D6D23_06408 [Aureobasidium pullulans]|uniref:Transcription factor domain-containing protein n=1 Tax=Aureobasidium pullulans TaxID=5580 RepID=A0A4S8ZG54_AURPU|nr:hypothetical protein D6D23_06408 [Aureobasidium pullulans]THW64816.1 hypothetical protein D6D20_02544 [Aureobasidium pullulans]TIA01812.1 hypothetical protein D6C82_03380 [Aureobasidium pullulans]